MLSALVLVLRFKNARVDSRNNYSHPATSFGYWTPPGDFGQPLAVCDHACSTIPICPQFPRMRTLCQNSICRPFQDRTEIATMCLVGIAIASTIKEAASGHMPHIVDADNDTNSARQRLQPMRNVKPVGYRVQMDHVDSIQLLRRRWNRQPPRPVPRLSGQGNIRPANHAIQERSAAFSQWRIFA